MAKVLACIDGSVYSPSVADHTAWAAERLGATVALMQVLGRRETASQDRSGRIVAGARRQLLEQLAELDAERAKLLQKQGWLDLEEASARIEAAGVRDVTTALRHGDLLDTLAEEEEAAALIVIGKRGEAADFAAGHLGSNLERILRASRKPVLVCSRAWRPIDRFVIAFDGRPSALKAVDEASRSPLFQGLEGLLLCAGEETAQIRAALDAAVDQLRAGGVKAEARVEPGAATGVVPKAVERDGADLLVMGAYGHSRLRTLMIGSTTSETIRASRVPILIYR